MNKPSREHNKDVSGAGRRRGRRRRRRGDGTANNFLFLFRLVKQIRYADGWPTSPLLLLLCGGKKTGIRKGEEGKGDNLEEAWRGKVGGSQLGQ